VAWQFITAMERMFRMEENHQEKIIENIEKAFKIYGTSDWGKTCARLFTLRQPRW